MELCECRFEGTSLIAPALKIDSILFIRNRTCCNEVDTFWHQVCVREMPQVQKWEVARGKCIYREPNVCSTIVLDSILETMVRQTTEKKKSPLRGGCGAKLQNLVCWSSKQTAQKFIPTKQIFHRMVVRVHAWIGSSKLKCDPWRCLGGRNFSLPGRAGAIKVKWNQRRSYLVARPLVMCISGVFLRRLPNWCHY